MQGKKLPNIETPDDLDELDTELIAALSVDPKATCEDLANKTGRSKSTVWHRLRRIRKSDWVEQMREELRSLGNTACDAIKEGMELGDWKDRSAVALKMLTGLGVLVNRTEHTGKDGEPLFDFNKMREAFFALSDDDKRKYLEQLRGGAGGSA